MGLVTKFSVLPHESILNQKQFIVFLLLTNFQSFVIRILDPNYELMLVRLVVLKVEQKKTEDRNAIPNQRAPVIDHLLNKRVFNVLFERDI